MNSATTARRRGWLVVLVLVCLVAPRIALYPVLGPGLVGSDGERRYLPQVEELSRSIGSIFFQIGPAYSLFLFSFKTLTNDLVTWAVLTQHVCGLLTGLLAFNYFKRVNALLAAFLAVFVYCGWLALWLEHSILRESLTAGAFMVLVVTVSTAFTSGSSFRLRSAVAAGCAGLVVVLLRIELVPLVLSLPPICLVATAGRPAPRRLWDRRLVRWIGVYLLPLAVVAGTAVVVKNHDRGKFQYGSLFDTSYYSLAYHGYFPRIFQYKESRYPALLADYEAVLALHREDLDAIADRRDKTNSTVNLVVQATRQYLWAHPEIASSTEQLSDEIYREIVRRNTLTYLQAVAVNFKSHLEGLAELRAALVKSSRLPQMQAHLAGRDPRAVDVAAPATLFDTAFRLYLSTMVIFGDALFWLSVLGLPLFLLRWRAHPPEVVVCLLVMFVHLPFLAVLADPAQRFRYAIDPFVYFLQFYLIWYAVKSVPFSRIRSVRWCRGMRDIRRRMATIAGGNDR